MSSYLDRRRLAQSERKEKEKLLKYRENTNWKTQKVDKNT